MMTTNPIYIFLLFCGGETAAQMTDSVRAAKIVLATHAHQKRAVNAQQRRTEYKVKNMSLINTEKSEFAPFVSDGQLLFIADRSAFDFASYSTGSNNEASFMNLYVSELNGQELKKERSFSGRLTSDYQNGPACVTADGQTLYFTRVSAQAKKNLAIQSQIFSASTAGGKVKLIRPLAISNESVSVAHPSISYDNRVLFFTSNMPGGYGGKDIWYCEKNGESWGTPVNLGPDINTSGDEMYPSVRKDGTLFFASNGLPGFGGLDIYSANKTDNKWIVNRNEGLDLNSEADDFGITFLNDSLGYFSSNRTGGSGEEDIYIFEYHNKSFAISGTVLLTENLQDYARNRKVVLLDENGAPVDSVFTDSKGLFNFRNLDTEKKYVAAVVETDPAFVGKARYYLLYNDSMIYRVSSGLFGKRFVFKNLPIDPNALPDLYTDDNLVFAGTLKYGDDGLPLKNAKVKIVNEYGDVILETHTNLYGAFAFRNIPSDQNYLVSVEESEVNLPEGTRIVMLNKAGKEVRSFKKMRDGFKFKVLQSDQALLSDMNVKDAELVMGIYGILYDQNKKPIANARIRMREEYGTFEYEVVTSLTGKFNFLNLSADKSYIFEADEGDPALTGVKKIYMANNRGNIYKVIELKGGKFAFRIMESDKFQIGEFAADDPWLKLAELKKKTEAKNDTISALPPNSITAKTNTANVSTITIVENIYYAAGDYQLDPAARSILNKAVDALKSNTELIMEISSHTDSKASDDFNLTLSKKRAQTAVDHIVKSGISKKRLKATGYGESKLLNDCANGVECPEEQHQKNRRTEFKFSRQ
jgi:outer membrane protein OmpA-like peptidoglycan-associated protein